MTTFPGRLALTTAAPASGPRGRLTALPAQAELAAASSTGRGGLAVAVLGRAGSPGLPLGVAG